jgi:hypothetical protein
MEPIADDDTLPPGWTRQPDGNVVFDLTPERLEQGEEEIERMRVDSFNEGYEAGRHTSNERKLRVEALKLAMTAHTTKPPQDSTTLLDTADRLLDWLKTGDSAA